MNYVSCMLHRTPKERYQLVGVGDEILAIEKRRILEVRAASAVTRAVRVPSYVWGVVKVLGRYVPVTDLRARLGLPPQGVACAGHMIVLRVGEGTSQRVIGVGVDKVLGTVELGDEQVAVAPAFCTGVEAGFVKRIGVLGDQVVMVLDEERVALSDEVVLAEGA